MDVRHPTEGRCRRVVLHRDTYRYTGRVPGGFEMHYTEAQCERAAQANGYCWQHQPAYYRRPRWMSEEQYRANMAAAARPARAEGGGGRR